MSHKSEACHQCDTAATTSLDNPPAYDSRAAAAFRLRPFVHFPQTRKTTGLFPPSSAKLADRGRLRPFHAEGYPRTRTQASNAAPKFSQYGNSHRGLAFHQQAALAPLGAGNLVALG
jgi:hypothetical protein